MEKLYTRLLITGVLIIAVSFLMIAIKITSIKIQFPNSVLVEVRQLPHSDEPISKSSSSHYSFDTFLRAISPYQGK